MYVLLETNKQLVLYYFKNELINEKHIFNYEPS